MAKEIYSVDFDSFKILKKLLHINSKDFRNKIISKIVHFYVS